MRRTPEPMDAGSRAMAYHHQQYLTTGSYRRSLTPRQLRRINRKLHRVLARIGGAR